MFQASFLVSVIFSTAVHTVELSFSLSTEHSAPVCLCSLLYGRIPPLFCCVLLGPVPPQTNEETWGYTLPTLRVKSCTSWIRFPTSKQALQRCGVRASDSVALLRGMMLRPSEKERVMFVSLSAQPHWWTNGGPAPPYSSCFVMQINSNTGVIGAEARCWAENTRQLWHSFVGPSRRSRRSYLMQMSPSFYVIRRSIFQLNLLYS